MYYLFIGRYNRVNLVQKAIRSQWTVVDVGCGCNSLLSDIKKGPLMVGLERYRPYVTGGKDVHDYYVIGDAKAIPFKSGSFDCAAASEVIEHLEKKDGVRMLSEMERVARKKIILTTPNGFLPVPEDKDNPGEKHLSGWTVEELKALGFKVYGTSGLKALWALKNGKWVLRFTPRWLPYYYSLMISIIISDITGFLVYKNPHRAFQLFFVKKLEESDDE